MMKSYNDYRSTDLRHDDCLSHIHANGLKPLLPYGSRTRGEVQNERRAFEIQPRTSLLVIPSA